MRNLIALASAAMVLLPAVGGKKSVSDTDLATAPCGLCLDYRYTSDTDLYPPFYSHTFGGGGDESLASAPSGGTKTGFLYAARNVTPIGEELMPVLNPTLSDELEAECPTAGEQTCQHWNSVTVECNSPSPHGCHSHIGANSCTSIHYPCRPYGYPESDLAVLNSSHDVQRLIQSFAKIAHNRRFVMERNILSFLDCQGYSERSIALRPEVAEAVEQALHAGLVFVRESNERTVLSDNILPMELETRL